MKKKTMTMPYSIKLAAQLLQSTKRNIFLFNTAKNNNHIKILPSILRLLRVTDSFARPSLGTGHDVSASQDGGDAVALDGGGAGVVGFPDVFQQNIPETRILKRS